MKMGAGLFWGFFLLLLGISLILRVVFHIDFPVFKVAFGILLILLGIKVLIGGNFRYYSHEHTNDAVFSERKFENFKNSNKEYNVVFGKGEFFYSKNDFDSTKNNFIEINTVFGGSVLWIDREIPVKINTDAVFANAAMPNGSSTAFGSNKFTSENFDMGKPHLEIKADVVFGSLEIRYR